MSEHPEVTARWTGEAAIRSMWPIIIAVVAGGIAWGTTTADVGANTAQILEVKEEVEVVRNNRRQDRDTLIELKTKVETLDVRTANIENDVKAVLRKLTEMEMRQAADS